jgi:SOS-response transcriptional repressor LexA
MILLHQVLDKMPQRFSSNQFSIKAQKMGLSKQEVANGTIGLFLHQHSIQSTTRRMWEKNNDKKTKTTIEEAIDLLKRNGYKIMKPISEYVEV